LANASAVEKQKTLETASRTAKLSPPCLGIEESVKRDKQRGRESQTKYDMTPPRSVNQVVVSKLFFGSANEYNCPSEHKLEGEKELAVQLVPVGEVHRYVILTPCFLQELKPF